MLFTFVQNKYKMMNFEWKPFDFQYVDFTSYKTLKTNNNTTEGGVN